MSPVRQDSQQASTRGPSPYACIQSNQAPQAGVPGGDSAGVTTNGSGVSGDGPADSSLPSHDQYRQLEANYLERMDIHSRQRVLISQGLFDQIWNALLDHLSDDISGNTRFSRWAKKTFAIHSEYTSTGLDESGSRVLSHNNRIVVTRDRIYGLLCRVHRATNHGGRDKMWYMIRQRYTWVPKALITAFLRACPTCAKKRNGERLRISIPKHSNPGSHGSIAFETTFPITSSIIESSAVIGTGHSEPTGTIKPSPPLFENLVPAPPMTRGSSGSSLGSHGMSREVSLYQGLPNGWQFRSDYPTAHAAFLDAKNHTTRDPVRPCLWVSKPRIPSIAPMLMGQNQTYDGLQPRLMEDSKSNATLPYVYLQESPATMFPILGKPGYPQLSIHAEISNTKTITNSTVLSRTHRDLPHNKCPSPPGSSELPGDQIPPRLTLDLENMSSRHSLQDRHLLYKWDVDSMPMSATSSGSSEAAPRTPVDEPTLTNLGKHFQVNTDPLPQTMMNFQSRF